MCINIKNEAYYIKEHLLKPKIKIDFDKFISIKYFKKMIYIPTKNSVILN